VAVISRAQVPGIEGNWFGSINPPGAKFDVVVHFEKNGNTWTGALLMENGARLAFTEIVADLPAISFSFNPDGGGKITMKGSRSGDPAQISGELIQGNQVFPFKLSRTPNGVLQDSALPSIRMHCYR
jgi:hypothetical protein